MAVGTGAAGTGTAPVSAGGETAEPDSVPAKCSAERHTGRRRATGYVVAEPEVRPYTVRAVARGGCAGKSHPSGVPVAPENFAKTGSGRRFASAGKMRPSMVAPTPSWAPDTMSGPVLAVLLGTRHLPSSYGVGQKRNAPEGVEKLGLAFVYRASTFGGSG